MSQQIIKQPNGKYCLFSSIVDNITHYDMTKEDIVEVWVEKARKDFEEKVGEVIEELDKKGKPYFQFTMSYDQILQAISKRYGNNEMEKIKQLIEK